MNAKLIFMGAGCALACLAPCAHAQFLYETKGESITITGYNGPGGEVMIPDSINGLPVTVVGDRACHNQPSLRLVTIPSTVTTIADNAFNLCTNLYSIQLLTGLAQVGVGAFAGCLSLTNIILPDSVTNLGHSAFYLCPSLVTADLGKGIRSVPDRSFYGCDSLTNILFSTAITNIGILAFQNCSNLKNAILPENLLFLGPAAFSGCTSLESVRIPDGMAQIFWNTFLDCTNLAEVSLGRSLRRIYDGAFWNCRRLESITLPASLRSLDNGSFAGCLNLRRIYFQGNPPSLSPNIPYLNVDHVTIYYLPGSSGWGPTFGSHPTVLWNPQVQTGDASFGIRSNRFGFAITGSPGLEIVVEAGSGVGQSAWTPLATNTLTDGSVYFQDPQEVEPSHPTRYYRIRSP